MIRVGTSAIWFAMVIACTGAMREGHAQDEIARFLPGMATSGYAEGLSFSANRLDQITDWYQAQADAGALSGAIVAIARNGKVAYLQAIGSQDRNKTIPLKPDSIFWIASMTKPITAVAAMMLAEEGKLDLTAPVYQYLPGLKGMQVAVGDADATAGMANLALELPKRPMTVLDLLRHTSGLLYPQEGTTAAHRLYRNAVFRRDKTLADLIRSLAELPLGHQPGEVWEYSFGFDVLARVIEVASGLPYDQFLNTRLFQPLHMVDTGFYVPEAKLDRLVDPPPGGRPALWDVTKKPYLFSGGGGLVSTAMDYMRFCQMLLNGGEIDGVRILTPETVRQMTTNSLPPDIRFAGVQGEFMGPPSGSTWGLGFAIRTNPEASLLPGSLGTFGWGGLWGTRFWIDPAQRLIAIQMIQIAPEEITRYYRALRYLTYAALHDRKQGIFKPPPIPPNVDAAELAAYAGHYDFGSTVSTIDKNVPPVAYGGVGMDFRMEDGLVRVHSVYRGGPAALAGIAPEDTITHIDDVSVHGLTAEQVSSKLRGPARTAVRLKIVHKDQNNAMEISLVRTLLPSNAQLRVTVNDGKLLIEAVGQFTVFDFESGKLKTVLPISSTEFYFDGGDHTRINFVKDGSSRVSGAVLNPGPYEVRGTRKY
jgi:CubicO group peptidase (beta-lactamase class C family)